MLFGYDMSIFLVGARDLWREVELIGRYFLSKLLRGRVPIISDETKFFRAAA